MKNIPRIFIDENLSENITIDIDKNILHYLTRVMRTDVCLVFNNGIEYNARVANNKLNILNKTNHIDPANEIVLAFSPIKKIEDLLNMATQMGVKKFIPVITERTTARHINWTRMKKIITEASEQSGRNSIPQIAPEIKFEKFISENKNIIYGDERMPHNSELRTLNSALLVGPEGGFSDKEFAELERVNAIGINLGKTILRAETAAVVLLARVIL